jgi:hypothetical protein
VSFLPFWQVGKMNANNVHCQQGEVVNVAYMTMRSQWIDTIKQSP